MLLDIVQRVVARFAARAFNFQPLPMGPCNNCKGEGVHTESTHRVKSLCVRCWGTGTDPKSVETLQEKVDGLTQAYQAKDKIFQEAKKRAMGRGGRELGMMGMELQTIRGEWTVREAQLKEEQERVNLGKQMAKIAGAAAR
jgi:hypothetical protein